MKPALLTAILYSAKQTGNLELMPLQPNQSKNDKIGDRQRNLAQKLHAAGLLAAPGKVH